MITIDPLASVHPDAILGEGVIVKPFAVVEAGAQIGEEEESGAAERGSGDEQALIGAEPEADEVRHQEADEGHEAGERDRYRHRSGRGEEHPLAELVDVDDLPFE